MAEPVAELFSFPTELSEFDDDDRISFSRLESKYIAVAEDGTEYEFEPALRRWIPQIDDSLFAEQQAVYGRLHEDENGDESGKRGKKRKQGEDFPNGGGKRSKPPRQPAGPKANTAIYVTGLPFDATAEQVAELFSRKCGVIAEEIDSGKPRVKMYTNNDGKFKGDALVVFFKPQSVDMAIMLLDDTDFRVSATGLGSGKMRVQPADASYKKTTYNNDGEGNNGTGNGNGTRTGAAAATSGEGSNGADKPRKPRNDAEKQKIIKKTQKLDAKLADWSDEEDSFPGGMPPPDSKRSTKWDKLVILTHMFTLQELQEDPAALLDIKEDIREECAKLGEVTNVVLYDEEASGIVTVKFKKAEAAQACIRLMDGRAFDGRVVEAEVATGKIKYKKSKKGDEEEHESEEDDD